MLFRSRIGSVPNCTEIVKLCKKHGVKIILGSDSHVCFTIGNFDKIQEILDSIDMPEELIINTDEKKLLTYLKSKGKLKDLVID